MQINFPDDRRSSRLSLFHLFLWFVVGSLLATQSSHPLSSDSLLVIAFNSAALTAALVAISQATLNREWVDAHPGHWLSMVVLWLYLDQWLVTPQLTQLAPRYDGLIYTLFYVGAAFLLLLGTLVGDWGRAWKLAMGAHAAVFALAATSRIIQAVWNWDWAAEIVRNYWAPPVDVLAVVLLVLAVLWDFRWKHLRDWMHWVGLIYFGFHWAKNIRAYDIPNLFK